jgi:dienelactone hydrolase
LSIQTRTVDYRDGDEVFEGLLAWDDEADSVRPGVLVAHTVRGRSDFENDKARKLAELGYVAFALDVYGKDRIGSDLEDCQAMMGDLKADRPRLQRRLGSALRALREQPEVDASRLAGIGFCFGGLCMLDIARMGEGVAGVVSFHGLYDPPGNTAGNRINAKILALHGWDDPLASPEQVLALAAEFSAAGADWQLHAYGNVRHAFTNPAADASNGVTIYNADADRRSWLTMQDFLSELFGT